MRLSTEHHPYYPNDWLCKEQAIAMLKTHGLERHLTMTFCRQNSIEVASTGHIRALALEGYIQREKARSEDW